MSDVLHPMSEEHFQKMSAEITRLTAERDEALDVMRRARTFLDPRYSDFIDALFQLHRKCDEMRVFADA